MLKPSCINKASLVANFSQPIDQTNCSEDTSNRYVSKIQKVSNSNSDSIAGISHSKQSISVFNDKCDSSINKSNNVLLSERMYKAKIKMPDQKTAIVMSFDRQLDLLEGKSQLILNRFLEIFKKHSFSQISKKQKEHLYIFIALINFILTSSLVKNNRKKIYEEFNDFFKKILDYKCDITILNGTTTSCVKDALKFQKMAKYLLTRYSETINTDGLSFAHYIKELALTELYAHFKQYGIEQSLIDREIENGQLFSAGFNIFYDKRMATLNNEEDILMRFNNIVNCEFIAFNALNFSNKYDIEQPGSSDITQNHNNDNSCAQSIENNKGIFQQSSVEASAPLETLATNFQNVKYITGWNPEYRLEFQPEYNPKNT
ncbi:MAG TPA: hypothetical protein ACHBZA_15435 [Arsenophonus apicola]|uniref:hypothetical protein n=1 Tax=Arsenophonus TaxID=637 RepID=UPI0015D809B5|nr:MULTISPECIES: hypothetical protein [Arsenophonus]UBX29635.1 hypothetical protein LDL57_02860 [Arsenophonus apicola]